MTSGIKVTHDEAVARALDNNYRWPKSVLFEKVMEKYPLICLTCGDDSPKWFHHVGRPGGGCKNCANVAMSLDRRLTQDQVVAQGLAAEHPAELLEPYKGRCDKKHKYRFLGCGHEHETTPNNLQQGTGCGLKDCISDAIKRGAMR
jgi:hypothetical protein